MSGRQELCVVQAVALARCASDPALRAEMAGLVLDQLHQSARRVWVHTDADVIPAIEGKRNAGRVMPFALDPFDEALALAITRFRRGACRGALRSRHAWVDAGWIVVDRKGWRHHAGPGGDRDAAYRLVPTEFPAFEAAVQAWDAAPPTARAVLGERLEIHVDLPGVPAGLPRTLAVHASLHTPDRSTPLEGCTCTVVAPRGGGARRTLRLAVGGAEAMLRLTGAQDQGHWLSFHAHDAAQADASGARVHTGAAFRVPRFDVPDASPAWAPLPETGLPYLSTLVQPQVLLDTETMLRAARRHRWIGVHGGLVRRLMADPVPSSPSAP